MWPQPTGEVYWNTTHWCANSQQTRRPRPWATCWRKEKPRRWTGIMVGITSLPVDRIAAAAPLMKPLQRLMLDQEPNDCFIVCTGRSPACGQRTNQSHLTPGCEVQVKSVVLRRNSWLSRTKIWWFSVLLPYFLKCKALSYFNEKNGNMF